MTKQLNELDYDNEHCKEACNIMLKQQKAIFENYRFLNIYINKKLKHEIEVLKDNSFLSSEEEYEGEIIPFVKKDTILL